MSVSVEASVSMDSKFTFGEVPVYRDVGVATFATIVGSNSPALLKGCNFGDCMKLWDLNYLRAKLENVPVTIHESTSSVLEFITKNFQYQKCLFASFVDKLQNPNGSKVYWRSTNSNWRSNKPARIEDDFASISDDLKPPAFIPYGENSNLYHSSVLRIASHSLQIWTHFDLYDNVLCQVAGSKRVILMPPEDSEYLYIKLDKSPVNEFENWRECMEQFPLVEKCHPVKVVLEPGDVLFIPALWWHNIKSIPLGRESEPPESLHSIGFNIFWKDANLEALSMYAKCDVYGNKNLIPVDCALANLDKAIADVKKMPEKYREFYKFMLLNRLKEALF